jgi:nucleoside-diphosphate kinase
MHTTISFQRPAPEQSPRLLRNFIAKVMLRLGEASRAGTYRDASADLSMTRASFFLCQYRHAVCGVSQETTQGASHGTHMVIIKPDGVQRGLIGPIVTRLERRGLRIAGMKLIQVSDELARKHYAIHEGKPFFPGLIKFITSGPVVVIALEGKDAIAITRATLGATAPGKAAPGTIRADFAMDIGYNLVHGSDGPETAAQELALWFAEGELLSYQRVIDGWIYE